MKYFCEFFPQVEMQIVAEFFLLIINIKQDFSSIVFQESFAKLEFFNRGITKTSLNLQILSEL